MARRPIKIKRYSSVGTRYRRRPAMRIVLLLLAVVVIFVIGWFGASRCIDAVTNVWYKYFSVSNSDSGSVSDSESLSVSVPDTSSSAAESAVTPPAATAAASEQQGVWGEVALSACGSEETLRAALNDLAAAGADHAVITLKDDRGYIYYASASELAATVGAVRSDVDVALFVKLCGEYGLVPCARLSAFRDPLAASGQLAVLYGQADGPRWLDSSPELGGKPWLNPYSVEARQYLLELAVELTQIGVKDVVFNAVQFPSGYSLDKCYYGEGSDAISRTECLREVVALLQSTLDSQNARAWFEWPTAAALGAAEQLVYGDGVAVYGAQRVLLQVSTDHTAEGLVVLPACDSDAITAFAAAAAQNGTLRLGLGMKALAADADLAAAWYGAAQAAGFTHFEN